MNSAQWLFEYIALREKEKEEGELVAQVLKTLKHILVGLLGLSLVPSKEGDEERIIPLSLMVARREVLSHIFEQIDEEQQVEAALEDDEFEKLSQAIAKGEDLGDMAPLFEIDEEMTEKLDTWFTPSREQELRKLGVKILDEPTMQQVSHHELDGAAIQQKKREEALNREIAKREIEQQIEEEKKRHKQKGVKVTFDGDA